MATFHALFGAAILVWNIDKLKFTNAKQMKLYTCIYMYLYTFKRFVFSNNYTGSEINLSRQRTHLFALICTFTIIRNKVQAGRNSSKVFLRCNTMTTEHRKTLSAFDCYKIFNLGVFVKSTVRVISKFYF